MANYPVSLDTITNPTSGNTLDNPSHSLQHSNANDILEALEQKVGIGSSVAGSATAGHALVASTGGTTSWTTIGTAGISSGAATSGQVLTANGTGGVSYTSLSTSGLVLLNTTNFSAVSSQSVNDVFSSTYDHYQLVFDFVGTQNASFDLRMRVSGADATGSNYARQFTLTTSTTYQGGRNSTQSYYSISDSSGSRQNIVTWAFNPNKTVVTTFRSFGGFAFDSNTALYIMDTVGNHQLQTAYTGFTISLTAGSMTGSVYTYGMSK